MCFLLNRFSCYVKHDFNILKWILLNRFNKCDGCNKVAAAA
jgi:hypothetical protein